MNTVPAPALYQQALDAWERQALVLAREEPAALARTRQQAMSYFREAGLPTSRTEDYKHTNLKPLLHESLLADDQTAFPAQDLASLGDLVKQAAIPGLDCYQVVLHNGQYLEDPEQVLPEILRVRPLEKAWQEAGFGPYFGRQTAEKPDAFAALNTALFRQGLYLEVLAGARPGKPLHLVHVYTGAGRLWQPRHLVVLQPQAALTLVESVVGERGQGQLLANEVSEVVLAPQARLDHYQLQAAQARGLLRHTLVQQQRDSVYTNATISLPGTDLLRNNLEVDLAAPHTESHLYGFYLGAGHQLIDNHTLLNHRHPQGQSNQIYKGVLLDTATGVFNGKVFVYPDAQQINAFQQNNNLLLGAKAVVYSKPQLEIYADDVKCSHGSTTGQLSPEALFYLRSRGLGEDQARALLVAAFAADVTGKVPLPPLREHLNRLLQAYLPRHLEMASA
ncbi:MAG: Fe-S cluster assembly protein SufD [Adhaeribacter sp.]